jgi:hypothetical protein
MRTNSDRKFGSLYYMGTCGEKVNTFSVLGRPWVQISTPRLALVTEVCCSPKPHAEIVSRLLPSI